jgi:hypothetical protein
MLSTCIGLHLQANQRVIITLLIVSSYYLLIDTVSWLLVPWDKNKESTRLLHKMDNVMPCIR